MKVKSLEMLKLQITHYQLHIHIAATTTPHHDELPLLHVSCGVLAAVWTCT